MLRQATCGSVLSELCVQEKFDGAVIATWLPVWGTGDREFKSPRSDHCFHRSHKGLGPAALAGAALCLGPGKPASFCGPRSADPDLFHCVSRASPGRPIGGALKVAAGDEASHFLRALALDQFQEALAHAAWVLALARDTGLRRALVCAVAFVRPSWPLVRNSCLVPGKWTVG